MHQDEELHAELLKVFREYFEENQRWLNEGTKASAIRLRKKLSEIRRVCSQRRVVVRQWAEWKEEQLQIRKEKRLSND
jgi:hypothetical protein